MWPESCTILIYRCGALGDTVVALPVYRALKNAWPCARILWMSQGGTPGVLWPDIVLRELQIGVEPFTYTAREISNLSGLVGLRRRVRALRPDAVVYLPNDKNGTLRLWRDRLFFLACGVRKVFMPEPAGKTDLFGKLNRGGRRYPKETIRLMSVLRRLGLADSGVCFFDSPWNLPPGLWERIGLGRDEAVPLFAVCPGSKMQSKRWPSERYARVLTRLSAHTDARFCFFGGNEDAAVCREIAERSGTVSRCVVAAGKLTLAESAALLARCRIYLGNDTGTMHLAAAVGVPCVAIFSARDYPESWYPWGEGHICLRADVSCEGCERTECLHLACLSGITEETVLGACISLLARQAGPICQRGK
jgi:heptosyltransferase III